MLRPDQLLPSHVVPRPLLVTVVKSDHECQKQRTAMGTCSKMVRKGFKPLGLGSGVKYNTKVVLHTQIYIQ